MFKLTSILIYLIFALPAIARSECAEYKIIDKGDSVEAVCVGAPLTTEEKQKIQQETKYEKSSAQQEIDRNYEELSLRKSREALETQEREERQRREADERGRKTRKSFDETMEKIKSRSR